MSQAMANDPSAPLSGTRTPRFRVLVNGYVANGVAEVEIESNNHYSSDNFSLDVSTSMPGAPPLSFWSDTDTITIEIQAAADAGPNEVLPTIFTGEVDTVEADPVGDFVRVSGRDLSRRFIDAKIQETFQNNTSSEIAEKLAARRGLTTKDVNGNSTVTRTTTLVSRYYKEDHDHVAHDQFTRTTTEWDLLVYLAQFEGFDVFVQGSELHFQPPTANTVPPFFVRLDKSGSVPLMNVESLHCTRSLTLAKDIEVWVRSWSPHLKRGHVKKAGGKSSATKAEASTTIGDDSFTKKDGRPGKDVQRVVVIRPNLTEDAALKLAQSIRTDLTQHERRIEFSMPGAEFPTARDRVVIQGTNSSFDQSYFVSSVTRRIGWQSGYTMDVRAKNTSPDNETIPL